MKGAVISGFRNASCLGVFFGDFFHIAKSWSTGDSYFDPTQNMSFLSLRDATILQVFVDVCFFC